MNITHPNHHRDEAAPCEACGAHWLADHTMHHESGCAFIAAQDAEADAADLADAPAPTRSDDWGPYR